MLRYIVTGGAGFIGCNMVRALVAQGHNVRVFDNFSTGREEALRDVQNEIEIIHGDIRDTHVLAQAFIDSTHIIHLAAIRPVAKSIEQPQEVNEVNISGTLNVLMAAREAKVTRVVLASSSAVYGDTDVLPTQESVAAHPQSPYAVTKLADEYYSQVFSELYGLPTVCLRYFNVYGPWQDPQSTYANVIPLFIKALTTSQSPILQWHGKQSRDFVYVDDVVAATLAATTATKMPGGSVYNIGSGVNTSLNDLLALLQRIMKTNLEVRYEPKRAGDVLKTQADISRAKRDLAYTPKVSLEEGLRCHVEWYRSQNARTFNTIE